MYSQYNCGACQAPCETILSEAKSREVICKFCGSLHSLAFVGCPSCNERKLIDTLELAVSGYIFCACGLRLDKSNIVTMISRHY
jgi:hypothetical protein